MTGLDCDVLVVGSGGAGLMAAIHARRSGMDTVVINKGPAGHTGATLMATGALAAVDGDWMAEGDSIALHIEDTLRGGKDLNELPLVKKVVRSAGDAVRELEEMGAFFDRDPATGRIKLLRKDAGHSKNRAISSGRRIGAELLQTLMGAALKEGVRFVGNTALISVEKDVQGRVCGALALDTEHMRLVPINASAVILSAGGAGNLFRSTDAPTDVTGDAAAAALLSGAYLTDMEFFQFHPAGLLKPDSKKGLLGTHLTLARLYNGESRRFMANYDAENLERATRDLVSRSMMLEIRAGRGSINGGIYAGLQHIGEKELNEKLPEYVKLYKHIGIDPKRDYVELLPTVHYTMGGLRVDDKWQTSLPGLFAAGEICGGVHGANRLSQNALTEMLVSGRIAGSAAAEYAAPAERSRISDDAIRGMEKRIESLYSDEGIDTLEWRKRLQDIMTDKVGVLRTCEGLESALAELSLLRNTKMRVSRSCCMGQDVMRAIENRAMCSLALTAAYAALCRRETRGAHMRLDFPDTDEINGLYHRIFRYRSGMLETASVPVANDGDGLREPCEDDWKSCDIPL